MADTIRTCDQLECARIEFDAERNHLLSVEASLSGSSVIMSSANTSYINERRDRVQSLESAYNNLKKDVMVKMDFLSSNRDKVLNKSLSLMNALLHSFFQTPPPPISGGNNKQMCSPSTVAVLSKLDSVLKAYSILHHSSSPSSPSAAAATTVVNIQQQQQQR